MATFLLLSLTSCATPKYKAFSDAESFKMSGKLIQGKSPKEAKDILGMPMSVYFKEDKSVYYMVYPVGSNEISLTDVILNKDLECLALNFEKEKNYKFDDWMSSVPFACKAMKEEKLDTSLID